MALYNADQLEAALAPALVALSGVQFGAKTLHAALVDRDGTGSVDNAELTNPLADTMAVLRDLGDRIALAAGVDDVAEALTVADLYLGAIASQLSDDARVLHAAGDDLRAQLADRILAVVVDPAMTIIAMVATTLPVVRGDQ